MQFETTYDEAIRRKYPEQIVIVVVQDFQGKSSGEFGDIDLDA